MLANTPSAGMTLEARCVSFRPQHLAGSAIDVEDPESRDIFLQDHCDYADTRSEKVVAGVLGVSRPDLTLAKHAEQNSRECARRHRNLVSAYIRI
jgi:hypothetical protein